MLCERSFQNLGLQPQIDLRQCWKLNLLCVVADGDVETETYSIVVVVQRYRVAGVDAQECNASCKAALKISIDLLDEVSLDGTHSIDVWRAGYWRSNGWQAELVVCLQK